MTDEPDSGDYRKARIGAAAALFGVASFLAGWDAISSTYELNVVVLGFILVAGLSCLAVDIPSLLRK